ncbi:exonuclease domain-containing protein [Actinomyces sp. B33]|uniref:exonuclease domain-containing protein n=1 Tax=Actinomyces sp. B33 TaxID=2942131 RepID=UPI002340496F|nr:exonuclease domain-containing protein [Actinomyces sp. B33]MDC4233647.1 exonuclease domain-containing protein [Actinomyces sp. B33]
MSWTDAPWLGFDTETTGVDVGEDRLVTAALVLRLGGSRPDGDDQVATWLADPGVEIPAQATAVHGISTEHAREHGRPIEEVLDEVAATLVEHWRRGYPVVAFNASYDITLVDCELRRHGLGSLSERLGSDPAPVIDPLVLDRALDRFRKGKRTLTTMAPLYGIEARADAHTAQADVAMTLDVLAGIAARYPEVAGMGAADLHSYQVERHREWAEDFQSYLRRQGRDAVIDPRWPWIG